MALAILEGAGVHLGVLWHVGLEHVAPRLTSPARLQLICGEERPSWVHVATGDALASARPFQGHGEGTVGAVRLESHGMHFHHHAILLIAC